MNSLFSVKEKVIILTGGYGILGACMARHLAKEGAYVVILGRNERKGSALVEELKADGGEAIFLVSDVLNRDMLEKNREDIMAKYGRIDVLVNLAGGNQAGATIPPDKTIFDLDIDAFKSVVDLNLFGTVLPTMVFAEVMVRQGKGSIINISSESSLRPLTRVVGYGCAKAAINNFTQYMAGELAIKFGEKLRVNAMAPGFFLTDQNRELMSNPDGTPTDRCRTIVAHTPFRRLGRPEELLGTLQWLASDASAFVNGTVIPIDGGFDAFSI
ncbi:D-mannonate oxidoreductase [gut metagenome]|uniref:D-mannonate oxidoreductase n=1 Tax=gut metagenome TaxID=749906 RepID=J9GH84_9ZZZZ